MASADKISMAKKKLRTIADPFVVALPTGTSLTTRIKPSPYEAEYLAVVGTYLGSLYRTEVSERVAKGKMGAEEKKEWTAQHKKTLTALTSSRWAGAIMSATKNQYDLSRRALDAEIVSRTATINQLRKRLSVPVGEKDDHGTYGYKTKRERYAKYQRLVSQERKRDDAMMREKKGQPRITLGGNKHWKTKNNLEAAGLTEQQWREQWNASRMFFTALGTTGEICGNQTIRVTPNGDGTGQLRIKTPVALISQWGEFVEIDTPINMDVWQGIEWQDRAVDNQSLTYTIRFNVKNSQWYLHVSWSIKAVTVPTVEQLGSQSRLAIDLNKDFLAAYIVDPSGNPVGSPFTVPLVVEGRTKGQRDAAVRQTVTDVLNHVKRKNISVIAVENLGFDDARSIGRETMGRGERGKTFRATVAGLPTAQFRDRLVAMAFRAGVWVIAVDPAYTSKWGKEHWCTPLKAQHKKSSRSELLSHHAAAVAIGRRSERYSLRRKPGGLRNGQRTVISLPTRLARMSQGRDGVMIGSGHLKAKSRTGPPKKKTVMVRGSSTVREPVATLPTATT